MNSELCTQAVEDAENAKQLNPAWPKPYHRLAQALAGLSRWEEALAACSEGSVTCGNGGKSDFEPLVDEISVTAVLHGCLAGFSGRRLEARHLALLHLNTAGQRAIHVANKPCTQSLCHRSTKIDVQVRDAGEEAWLGREAPEDPELDGPEEPLLALPSSSAAEEDSGTHANSSRVLSAVTYGGTSAQHALGVGAAISTAYVLKQNTSRTPAGSL